MKMYKAYIEKGIDELGQLNSSYILELLKESEEADQVNSFSVGICRSDKDFIEVGFVGKNQYLIWSDRLCKTGSFWQRLNQSRNINKIITGRDSALKAIDIYTNKTREEFEQKYT